MTYILSFRILSFDFQVEYDYNDAPLEARKQLLSFGKQKGRGFPEPLSIVEHCRFHGDEIVETELNYISAHKQPLHPYLVTKYRNRLDFVRVILNCSRQSHIPETFYTNLVLNWQSQ